MPSAFIAGSGEISVARYIDVDGTSSILANVAQIPGEL